MLSAWLDLFVRSVSRAEGWRRNFRRGEKPFIEGGDRGVMAQETRAPKRAARGRGDTDQAPLACSPSLLACSPARPPVSHSASHLVKSNPPRLAPVGRMV